jgi:sugar-specific transcriptional regulator TrmB
MNGAQKKAIEKRLADLATLNRGRLTPSNVVADAKPKASPMHDQFEWHNGKAAELHRLWQARNLIKIVKIEVHTERRVVTSVRYVRDPKADAKEQGYVDVVTLRSDKDLAFEALESEINRASVLMDRALDISEALELDDMVGAIIERIDMVKRRLLDRAA